MGIKKGSKKRKRFIMVLIFLIIPSLAGTGYVLYRDFFPKNQTFSEFYKDMKERGLSKLIFPTLAKMEDGLSKLGVKVKKKDGMQSKDNEGVPDNEGLDQAESVTKVPVTVFKAFKTGFRDTLPALGTLKGHRETKISFEKPGTIAFFNFKEGDLVAEGALICSLDKQENEIKVRHAEAKLKEEQSNLSLADNKLKRAQQLFKIGGMAKSMYEAASFEYEKNLHAVESAKIELENTRLELKKCDLFSPYEGLLGNKYVETGEAVSNNTLVCDIIDVAYMIAEIGVVERDIEKVSEGQKVSIYVDAYPNREFIGKVENISPIVEGQSRTFSVKIKIANPQKVLLPGMFARVKVNVFEQKDALIIPTTALSRFRDKTFVYVVNQDAQVANERPVAITYQTSDYVVISRGLREGELVVIGEKQGLSDGAIVKVVEQQVPEI